MTSFPDNADFSKIMLLSLEKGEIDILHLPKEYERSEKKKEEIPLSYPRRLRQRGRGLPCAATLEREKLLYFLNLRYLTQKPRPGLRPDGHILELLRFTGQIQSHGRG
jgi:hypothetical protein